MEELAEIGTLWGIFDSHAHYNDEAFNPDREDVLERVHHSGVVRVMNIGADLQSSRTSVALAEKYDWIWATVGVHPHDVLDLPGDWLDQLRRLAAHPKVMAIGEIGLDYHYDTDWKPQQQRAFAAQLELARELGLPVVIHSRDAHQDTLDILRQYRPEGVVHCYSGSAEMARQLLDLGLYLGFTGAITFKNARRAAEVIEMAPLDRLLVETDCPYMAPVPYRGKRCDGTLLPLTLARLGEIKSLSPQEMAQQTAQNASCLFGLKA